MGLHLVTGLRTVWRTCLIGLLFTASAAAAQPAQTYFERTDSNDDGVVSREEYRHRMIEVFYSADGNRDGMLMLNEVIDANPAIFNAADADGNSQIELREFLEFRAGDFERADTNDDGTLSWPEMR